MGGRAVETSNRRCLGYYLRAGIIFPEPPSHKNLDLGREKTAMLSGCGPARLLEVSCSGNKVKRSAGHGQEVLDGREVQWVDNVGDTR
jgi:hypothetical protein